VNSALLEGMLSLLVQNSLQIGGALILFAILHSLTAGVQLKGRLKALLGERLVEGWYRLAYNFLAAVTFLPVLALVSLLPDRTLYRVGLPWSLLMVGVQVAGIGGLLASLITTDVGQFLGLSQALAYLRGDPLPLREPPLQVKGMYALMRHPLYFFTLLVIWPLPVMTVNILIFNLGATLYLAVGSLIEERRLEKAYGDAYRTYRRQVPWLIPRLRRRSSPAGGLGGVGDL